MVEYKEEEEEEEQCSRRGYPGDVKRRMLEEAPIGLLLRRRNVG